MSQSSAETEAWLDGTRVTSIAGAVDKLGASGLAQHWQDLCGHADVQEWTFTCFAKPRAISVSANTACDVK